MDNLKLDGAASTWSLDNFAVAIAAHRPALSWAAVAERLDCPGFGISSEVAFTRLVIGAASSECYLGRRCHLRAVPSQH